MHVAVATLAVFLSFPVFADCTPADPKAIAAAEKKASDAAYKAEQAEAIAVKSGNPGAAARASQARAEASAAERQLANLQCKVTGGAPGASQPKNPMTGY
jgi:hypothetical protein